MSESAQALARRALKAVTRSSPSSLQFGDVPFELLMGDDVDLHRWSIILKDKNLKLLSEQEQLNRTTKRYFLNCSCDNLNDMFKNFWMPYVNSNGIIRLDLSGAKDITDFGLGMIARKSLNLTFLNVTSCINITDNGVREVGLHCLKLQDFIMSSCHNIEGSGLVAIADCCKNLVKLDVSKCRKLQNWSLTKIFYKCYKLQELNINYLKDVGDDEIRTLAQNCTSLTTLHAVECYYISDTSMLSLTQNCLDLEFVDLTRSQMSFRITDVSLLSFGQRSKYLKVLRLNGCDHITDVGLTWLAEGCIVLQELDLCRCLKV
jgi:F-box/leucine-rich repeat protein 2/20